MKKRILSLAIALMMALALVPAVSIAASQRTTTLDLSATTLTYAGGAGTGDPTTSDITDSTEGWKWYFNQSAGYDSSAPKSETNYPAKTLILDGANINISGNTYQNAIKFDSTSTVLVKGNNTIRIAYTGDDKEYYEICGINADGNINFYGGGTLNITTLNSKGSCGISCNTATFDGPTVTCKSDGDTAYGVSCARNHNIYINSGTVTATATTSALNKVPSYGGATATILAGTAAPGTSVSAYNNERYVNITFVPAPTATVSNVTVNGTVGTAITGTDVTINLTNEKFKAMTTTGATTLADWFTNAPAGLTFALKADVADNATSATITVSGTPTAIKSEAMGITIPAASLVGAANLTVTANANAKWAIAADTNAPTITLGAQTGTLTAGTVGSVTYSVAIANFTTTTGKQFGTVWYTDDTGATTGSEPVGMIISVPGGTTCYGNNTKATPAGIYYFKITYEVDSTGTPETIYSNMQTLTIGDPAPLAFADSASYDVPTGQTGTTYTATTAFTATGGTAPYTFTVDPAVVGLSINADNKLVYVRPSAAADATTATIKVTDGASASATITIDIGAVTAAPVALYYSTADGKLHENAIDGAVYAGNDGKWSASADKLTLTLSGFTYSTAAAIALTVPAGTTIELADGTTNTITSTYNGSESTQGIDCQGALNIQGMGSLSCTGGKTTGDASIGLGCRELTVKTGATLSGFSGEAGTWSYAIWCNGALTVEQGAAVFATASTASYSNGVYSSGITINGSLLAQGNSLALNKAPTLGTDVTAKGSASFDGSNPADYTSGTVSGYKWFEAKNTAPFATVSSVTVSGTIGTAITATEVTINLVNEKFNALAADTDVSGWFTNLPAGLAAKIKTAVNANDATATITVSGTPTAAKSEAMAITIPAASLVGNAALTVTANANAKWAIANPPNPPSGDDYTPSQVTVYNDPSQPKATIWLTGSGLTAGDLLITERNPEGSAYKAMLKLAGDNKVFNTYNIYLRSGRKSTGSAMYLTFDLATKYAGQAYTLVHQKADGTYEYFYATADVNGDLKFGPLYELSPFMLVRGTIGKTAVAPNIEIPQTGDNTQRALWTGLALISLLGFGAMVYVIKRKRA